jgi:hypothetical protein
MLSLSKYWLLLLAFCPISFSAAAAPAFLVQNLQEGRVLGSSERPNRLDSIAHRAPWVTWGLSVSGGAHRAYARQANAPTNSQTYVLSTQWLTQLGYQLDFGPGHWGLRLAPAIGLQRAKFEFGDDWSKPNSPAYYAEYAQRIWIDELQLTFSLQANLRYQTLGALPWIFQVGARIGTVTQLQNDSRRIYKKYPDILEPMKSGYAGGPLLTVSKQFQLGNHKGEGLLEIGSSWRDIPPSSDIRSNWAMLGLIYWLN